jgi:hypothetical protein
MGEESKRIRWVQDKDLSETERAELELLRKDNAVLRVERDFARRKEEYGEKVPCLVGP